MICYGSRPTHQRDDNFVVDWNASTNKTGVSTLRGDSYGIFDAVRHQLADFFNSLRSEHHLSISCILSPDSMQIARLAKIINVSGIVQKDSRLTSSPR